MTLIYDQNVVWNIHLNPLLYLAIKNVVVRHQYDVSNFRPNLVRIVWTKFPLFSKLGKIFYIDWAPRKLSTSRGLRCYELLVLTLRVVWAGKRQGLPSELNAIRILDFFIDTKLVSWSHQYHSWIIATPFKLILHLSELRVCPARIDNPGKFIILRFRFF